MTGKEYLLRFRYQMDIVDRIAIKLNATRNAKISIINPNNLSIEHSNNVQRTSEDAAVLQEQYARELDILHEMRLDLMRLVTQITDNLIATYLIKRYYSGCSTDQISKELRHTVKWLDCKAAEALDSLL